MPPSPAAEAAQRLATARRDGAKLPGLPAALQPGTLAEAYAIQAEAARQLGPIGGWKVGADPDGTIKIASIPAAYVHRQAVAPSLLAPAQLEVELGLLIGTSLPAGPFTPATLEPAIAAAHVILEALDHRFTSRDAVSDLTFLADGNGNGSVIIGDALPHWRDLDLATLDVTLASNGATIAHGTSGASSGQLLSLLTALATHAAQYAGGLQAGQIVITGARAGPATARAAAEGRIGDAGVRVMVR